MNRRSTFLNASGLFLRSFSDSLRPGKEGTWKQTAEQAGYWMGLVAVALFILIGWAYHTKLSEEERKDKCAPCRAALLTVTNRDSAVMDEAEQALGLKASKD